MIIIEITELLIIEMLMKAFYPSTAIHWIRQIYLYTNYA